MENSVETDQIGNLGIDARMIYTVYINNLHKFDKNARSFVDMLQC
jgi:hypothetical protein